MMYLFFAIFLLVYLAICFYIGYNGFVWLRQSFSFRYKWAYIACIAFLSFSVFFDRFFSTRVLAYISGIWFLIIGYGLILLPIINLIYFLNKKRGAKILGGALVIFFIGIVIFGSYNAWNPVVRTYEISIDKQADQKEFNILMVTDLHLGKIVGNKHLERLVTISKEMNPDMVVIAGDIIDDYIKPYQDEQMGETLSKIKAPLGVYATSGNHDYYGDDLDELHQEMEKAGITMLSDESVNIEDSFFLVGRNDLTDKHRKTMKELIGALDKNLSIIMLDHQPNEIDEASKNGVDILLSGHTHGGQIAPANIITGLIYENDWGYLKKGDLHSIVSSGYGLWGPPFRIGTQSEVVQLKIKFKGKE